VGVLGVLDVLCAAWKLGQVWETGPNPIPIDYVTRAGFLWKTGEAYRDNGGELPAAWQGHTP